MSPRHRLWPESCASSEGAPAWERLLDRLPDGARTSSPTRARRFPSFTGARLPFRSRAAAGPGLGAAPLGRGVRRSPALDRVPAHAARPRAARRRDADRLGRPAFDEKLRRHEARTFLEVDAAALLVSALYARFHDFPVFAALTHLYFAAASFAESARRLGRPALAGAFLSADHPTFGPALVRVLPHGAAPAEDRDELLAADPRGHRAARRHRASGRLAPQLVSGRPGATSTRRPTSSARRAAEIDALLVGCGLIAV